VVGDQFHCKDTEKTPWISGFITAVDTGIIKLKEYYSKTGGPVETLCVQLYNNLYTFSPIPSCVAIPNCPSNRPLSEHQESDQSDHGAPKCVRQSNPSLLGCARLNQNRKLDSTGRCRPHRVSQPIRGSPRNPHVHDRTIGDKWGEAVQKNRGNAGRTGIYTEDRGTFYRREVFYSMYL
jgi:hypothetical protein